MPTRIFGNTNPDSELTPADTSTGWANVIKTWGLRLIKDTFGSAALKDHGIEIGQIPVNTLDASLGTAAYKNFGNKTGEVPEAVESFDLSSYKNVTTRTTVSDSYSSEDEKVIDKSFLDNIDLSKMDVLFEGLREGVVSFVIGFNTAYFDKHTLNLHGNLFSDYDEIVIYEGDGTHSVFSLIPDDISTIPTEPSYIYPYWNGHYRRFACYRTNNVFYISSSVTINRICGVKY